MRRYFPLAVVICLAVLAISIIWGQKPPLGESVLGAPLLRVTCDGSPSSLTVFVAKSGGFGLLVAEYRLSDYVPVVSNSARMHITVFLAQGAVTRVKQAIQSPDFWFPRLGKYGGCDVDWWTISIPDNNGRYRTMQIPSDENCGSSSELINELLRISGIPHSFIPAA